MTFLQKCKLWLFIHREAQPLRHPDSAFMAYEGTEVTPTIDRSLTTPHDLAVLDSGMISKLRPMVNGDIVATVLEYSLPDLEIQQIVYIGTPGVYIENPFGNWHPKNAVRVLGSTDRLFIPLYLA